MSKHDYASIMNLVSSLFIVFGLPLGFFIVLKTLNPIDHLKNASAEIGEGFMTGIQRGINETALNALVKTLTHTVVIGATIVPENQIMQRRFYI
jgi:hypothetical protein